MSIRLLLNHSLLFLLIREEDCLKEIEAKKDIPKIGAIVKDSLNAKLTYEEILNNVLKHHPESRFNKKHLSWYKNRLGLNKT
jgi:hypothetical protein